jgi:ribosomal 50S subunit-recycling heat shock protein
MMKKSALFSIVAATLFLAGNNSFAAEPNTYQVTGPILEVKDDMVAVQKGKERWEIARDSGTKASGDLKVGDKVTITYTMRAKKIDVKAAGKDAEKAASSASPSPSPVTAPAKR